MTPLEAKRIITDNSATFSNWVHATGVLTSSSESTLEDLILCLKRRGLPAEMAATALYVRTKRPQATNSIESLVVDFDDWAKYVKQMRESK